VVSDREWKRRAKAEGWSGFVRSDADELACRQGFYFDRQAAERVFRFFERVLRHSKGAWGGQPFLLEPWQKDELLGPIFGWKRPDGTRRFRRAHIELPTKNGKSSIAAGVGLYMLRGDGEPGADVFSAATRKEQASLVHDEAISMVRSSPLLSKQLGFGGLDLADKGDIAAWLLLFPPTDASPKWRILPRFYVPKENAGKRESASSAKYENLGTPWPDHAYAWQHD
jgi:phage terminase large subunit-like protein